MATPLHDKKADLAGPGIGNYDELEKILPQDYSSLLTPKETQKAVFEVKNYIEENLCKELNLMMVTVPLIVDMESGVNDMLDRDGSRTPVQFHISNDHDQHPVDAQVVQAATKWKRMALKQFEMKVGEGLCTDMRAVRKDYFLDHDHSAYVDQWDWERAITEEQRNLDTLKDMVKKIWKVIKGAEIHVQKRFPKLKQQIPDLPTSLRSSMPKKSWTCTRTFRASSARQGSFRNTRPCSSLASDGPCRTAIPTRCAPQTMTTG